MGYPEELLGEGEYVLLHKHPHWKMLVLPVLALLLVVAAAGYLASMVSSRAWSGYGWIGIGAGALVAVCWFTLAPLLRWCTTHFVVTTRRVLVREGVFTRSGMAIPMDRVNTVQFRHSLLERLLGCGTLSIESASDEPLEFDDIPGVVRAHAVLYQGINEAGSWQPPDPDQAGRG